MNATFPRAIREIVDEAGLADEFNMAVVKGQPFSMTVQPEPGSDLMPLLINVFNYRISVAHAQFLNGDWVSCPEYIFTMIADGTHGHELWGITEIHMPTVDTHKYFKQPAGSSMISAWARSLIENGYGDLARAGNWVSLSHGQPSQFFNTLNTERITATA